MASLFLNYVPPHFDDNNSLCVCLCDILLLFSVYCVADGEGMEERGRREGGRV